MISEKLRHAIKLSRLKSYQIAQAAHLHPSTPSRLVCGIEQPKPGDRRILAVARVLGIPAHECFSETEE